MSIAILVAAVAAGAELVHSVAVAAVAVVVAAVILELPISLLVVRPLQGNASSLMQVQLVVACLRSRCLLVH